MEHRSDPIELRPPVAKDIDGAPDSIQHLQFTIRGQNLLVLPAGGEQLPPRINDCGRAAVMCLARVAAGIAADDERLILNRPRDRQRPQMSDARRWPLAHDEEHVHPLHGECPRQLREADVIADYKAAVVSVEPEAAEMIAGREIRMLAHRRKQARSKTHAVL